MKAYRGGKVEIDWFELQKSAKAYDRTHLKKCGLGEFYAPVSFILKIPCIAINEHKVERSHVLSTNYWIECDEFMVELGQKAYDYWRSKYGSFVAKESIEGPECFVCGAKLMPSANATIITAGPNVGKFVCLVHPRQKGDMYASDKG